MEKKIITMICSACGGNVASRYIGAPDPLTGELFDVVCCTRCGLGHTIPRPADVGRYYGEQYYGNRHGFTLQRCLKRRLGFVAAALPGVTGRLLDIGCGDGSFLLAARDAGWEVAGTELNPQAARSHGLEVHASIDQVAVAGPFACITMWHTLEHMVDPPAMLKQVAGLLAPGGRLIVAVPDFSGLQARLFGKRWLHLDVPRHLYHFDARSLGRCLEAAGLSIRQRRHQEFEYDLLGWSQSTLNYLLPQPNLFFSILTGKAHRAGRFARCCAVTLGGLLTLLSLPLLPLGSLLGRGGTLVVVAGKERPPEHPHD